MLYVDEILRISLRIAFFGSGAIGACLRVRGGCGGLFLLLVVLWRDVGLERKGESRLRRGAGFVVLESWCRGRDVRRYCIGPLDRAVGV